MSELLCATQTATRSNWFDGLMPKRKLLTCFYPVNDPLMPREYLDIYYESGVDIIELGLPVNEPYMDGPTVAQSLKRSLDSDGYMQAFESISSYIQTLKSCPALICMTYADFPRKKMFGSSAWQNIDALLMVGFGDVEDKAEIKNFMKKHDVRFVDFIDHDLSREMVSPALGGDTYVMLQAVSGKTGSGRILSNDNRGKISGLKKLGLKQPVLLGFGISELDQVRAALDYGADGVIIGSACIENGLLGPEALRDYLFSVREILDAE